MFTNLAKIGAKTVAESLMASSNVVASSGVISSNLSNLEKVCGSTVRDVESAVRDRMSSTFFVKKFWNARGQEFS